MRVYLPFGNESKFPAVEVPFEEAEDRGTVLVVDDEDVVRSTAKVVLSRLGYRVLLARDGEEAVHLFSAERDNIDVILLDMTMPVMGGEEALQHLVQLRPGVVVLGSSGFDEQEAQRRFGQSLAGFLQKPYSAAQLRKAIARIRKKNQ